VIGQVGFFLAAARDDIVRIRPCHRVPDHREESSMGLILLIVIVVLLMGGLPNWRYSRNWGYGPSSGLGLLLGIVVVLLVAGYIPRGF
jgi:hypothetical protein